MPIVTLNGIEVTIDDLAKLPRSKTRTPATPKKRKGDLSANASTKLPTRCFHGGKRITKECCGRKEYYACEHAETYLGITTVAACQACPHYED